MITVENAAQIMQAAWTASQTEVVPLQRCEGRILAEPIYADRDYPPIDRVMMDGIAIPKKTYDQGCREFPLMGSAMAGMAPLHLENPNAGIEVMTGCALPGGTDLVIPYEQLSLHQGVAKITVETDRNIKDFVHQKASDCQGGELVLTPGTRLKGTHLGILASFGYTKLLVKQWIKIKVIATGDELIPIEQKPQSYQLRRSNVYALRASLISYGYPDVEIDYIPDAPELIIAHYQKNQQPYDLLIYAGGVSRGQRDYLPGIWQRMGVVPYIQGVKQKPGKPMWFGIDQRSHTMIFGLPGNPVSALVCLHRYLLNRTKLSGYLQQSISFQPDLTYFVPVKMGPNQELIPIMPQNSGDFIALANSDGFVELPQAQKQFTTREQFPFYPWY